MSNNVIDSALEKWWEDQGALESASINVGKLEKGSHEFVVSNYSRCTRMGVNKLLESDYFAVGGYYWSIVVYPNGRTDEAYDNGNISVYVALKSECSVPVKTLHELYLIDQSGENNHWGYTFFYSEELREGYVPSHTEMNSIHGRDHFINRATLERQRLIYLKDDCLRISCTVGVFTNRIQDLPILETSPGQTIYTDFERLLKSKWRANIFFEAGNEIVCAHKCILGARSPVLQSFFSDAHQPEQIRIPNIEPTILKAMLWFIYTGNLVEEEEEASGHSHALVLDSFLGKMLAAAHQFKLKSLKGICESRISEKLCGESLPYLLRLADICHATKLKAACLKFAAENQIVGMESILSSLEISSFREHSGVRSPPGHNQGEDGDGSLSRQKQSSAKKLFGSLKKLNRKQKK